MYDKDVGIINLMIPDLLLVLIVYFLTVLLQRGKQQELSIWMCISGGVEIVHKINITWNNVVNN